MAAGMGLDPRPVKALLTEPHLKVAEDGIAHTQLLANRRQNGIDAGYAWSLSVTHTQGRGWLQPKP